MLITGVWLTTRSNYKKNHLFFKSWSRSSIKVQPIFEPLEANPSIIEYNSFYFP